jgi:hypothetical protein
LGSQEFVQIRTGEFHMPRIPLGISAIVLAAAVTILPNQGMAFDMENAAVTVPGGSTKFQD